MIIEIDRIIITIVDIVVSFVNSDFALPLI